MTWIDVILYGPGWLALPLVIIQIIIDSRRDD